MSTVARRGHRSPRSVVIWLSPANCMRSKSDTMAKLMPVLLLLSCVLLACSSIAAATYGPVSNCVKRADRISCRLQSIKDKSKTKLTCCQPTPGKPSCEDLRTAPGFCGSCTNACPKDQICERGKCVDAASCAAILCLAPSSCCSGACYDLQTDFNNCGACGTTCAYPPGMVGIPRFCQGGECVNG